MTNEELACAIKAGNTALYNDLWKQVELFVIKYARRFYTAHEGACISHGVTDDDLTQSGFLAVVGAVKDYKPETGYRFTTFLKLHLKQQFYAALHGGRRRTTEDMLNCCDSLDKPVGKNEDGNLLDCILDPDSQFLYEDIDSHILKEELREEMEGCLNSIKPARAEVLRLIFYDGTTLQEAGNRTGRTKERIRQIRNLGLKDLTEPKMLSRLQRYRENLDA